MNLRLLAVVAFAVWTVLAGVIGWQMRDGRADATAQTQETAREAARADAVQSARDTDHRNAQASAQAEQQRIERKAERDAHFDKLQQDIREHASNPTIHAGRAGRGNADPEFMRVWREANAGRPRPPELGNFPGAVGGTGIGAAATDRR